MIKELFSKKCYISGDSDYFLDNCKRWCKTCEYHQYNNGVNAPQEINFNGGIFQGINPEALEFIIQDAN